MARETTPHVAGSDGSTLTPTERRVAEECADLVIELARLRRDEVVLKALISVLDELERRSRR